MLKQANILVTVFFIFIPTQAIAALNKITCATTHYPPYTIFNKSSQTFTGLDMAIITPLFIQLNYDVKIINLPWARLKKEIVKNTYDCYFSLAKFKYREETLEYSSIPTHVTRVSIFHPKKEKNISFKNKNVGIHRGINFHNDILSFYDLRDAKFHRLPSNKALFQMLYRRRIEAVVTSKLVGEYILANQYANFSVDVLDIEEYKLPVYIAFKKGVVNISQVNEALTKILNETEPKVQIKP